MVVGPQPVPIAAAMLTVVDRGVRRTRPRVNRRMPLCTAFQHEANDGTLVLEDRRGRRPGRRDRERVARREEVSPRFYRVDVIPGVFVNRLVNARRTAGRYLQLSASRGGRRVQFGVEYASFRALQRRF